jgi:cell wall-associated NlpC family hydrolase
VAVGAQTVESAEAEAARIEADLADTRDRIVELAETYNQAQARAEEADAHVARAAAELEATRAELGRRRAEMSDFAVDAYVRGGDLGEVDGLLSTDVTGVGQRLGYLDAANSTNRDIADQLVAAQEDLDLRLQQLAAAEAEAEAHRQAVADAQAEADALAQHQEDLLANARGRVAELIAAEEARRAAEEEARAREAAGAAAAAAAAAYVAPEAAVAATTSPARAEAARPPATPSVSAPRAIAQLAVDAALSQVGVPYVFGGNSPGSGFDCSGLMQWAWAQAGRSIPRPADYQRDALQPISLEELQPGDIIFYGEPVSHDAMYIGGDMIVNAPYTGEYVRVQSMWYSSKPMTFGRVN